MSTARTTRETYLQNRVKKGLSLSNGSETFSGCTDARDKNFVPRCYAVDVRMYVYLCVCSVVLDYYLCIFLSG